MMQQNSRDQIVRELFDTMGAIKRVMTGHMTNLNREYPVSRSQLELLSAIHHAASISFKDLAGQLCLTPGAVSQLVEGLEQHHLVSRRVDPEDRRVQCLQLTGTGSKLLKSIEKHRTRMLSEIIEDLTDEELALWLGVQQKVLHRFQTEASLTAKQKKEH